MDYIESLVCSIDFIETNLTAPLTVDAIAARAAYYSLYHYVRLFRILTGETPGGYLRKRRLTEAAHEVATTSRPLVDIVKPAIASSGCPSSARSDSKPSASAMAFSRMIRRRIR